jgi:hypothetical protein
MVYYWLFSCGLKEYWSLVIRIKNLPEDTSKKWQCEAPMLQLDKKSLHSMHISIKFLFPCPSYAILYESESMKVLCMKFLPKNNNCHISSWIFKSNPENTQYPEIFSSMFQRHKLKFVNRVFLESHMKGEKVNSCFVRSFPHAEEASDLINYSCDRIYLSSLPLPQEKSMILVSD